MDSGIRKILENLNEREIWYHLTNDKNFSYNPNYQNSQTEMGAGLYITPKEDISTWDTLLQRRDYAVPVNIDNLKILDMRDIPDWLSMQKELAKNGYSGDDVRENIPKGDTFGMNPKKIATIITWAKFKGYDAIKPILDREEGEQIIILDNADIYFGDSVSIESLL